MQGIARRCMRTLKAEFLADSCWQGSANICSTSVEGSVRLCTVRPQSPPRAHVTSSLTSFTNVASGGAQLLPAFALPSSRCAASAASTSAPSAAPQRNGSSASDIKEPAGDRSAGDRPAAAVLSPSEVSSHMMVDTLLMMKKYEAAGLSRGQAEALTRQITEIVLSVCSFNSAKFITNEALERLLIELRAQQARQGQEMATQQQVHLAGMSKDTERLQGQLDKFKADIKHDVDKLTANQKLDLNLERGRIRDELQQVRDQMVNYNSECLREVNSVRTMVESSKSDTLKWVVVTVGGLLGAGLAAIRLSLSV